MGWQMMDVSALADLGVPWRESSFLFNPRLQVCGPRLGRELQSALTACARSHVCVVCLRAQLPAELCVGHALVSADRVRVRRARAPARAADIGVVSVHAFRLPKPPLHRFARWSTGRLRRTQPSNATRPLPNAPLLCGTCPTSSRTLGTTAGRRSGRRFEATPAPGEMQSTCVLTWQNTAKGRLDSPRQPSSSPHFFF